MLRKGTHPQYGERRKTKCESSKKSKAGRNKSKREMKQMERRKAKETYNIPCQGVKISIYNNFFSLGYQEDTLAWIEGI